MAGRGKQVSEWDSTNEFEFDVMASSLVYKPYPSKASGSRQQEPTVFTTSVEFGVPTVHERRNTQASKLKRNQVPDDSDSTAMQTSELLIHSSKRSWTYARRAALLLYFICFVILFIVAITLLTSTSCHVGDDWQKLGIGYYILPRSFKDSDGNGIGDLNGIKEKLSYLKDIGVTTIWLGSVLQTSYKDLGYDVTDFKSIDPVIGTLEDFTYLIDEVHKQGMYIILEIPPNHTSDQHEWFVDSRTGTNSDFSDHYIWASGVNGGPPNNWISMYGGSAWTYVSTRNQWYLHTLSEREPDLNYRSEDVEKQMTDILHHWLSQNIDGLYLRHVNMIFESSDLNQNEPENPEYLTYDNETKLLKSYDKLIHSHTRDQHEIYGLLRRWRDSLQKYETITGDEDEDRKILVVDVQGSSLPETAKYLSNGWIDYAFNYALYNSISGNYLASQIEEWLRVKPDGAITSWSIGSPDHHRIQSQYHISKALMTLLLTLPGSPIIYYGDEIGMSDIPITSEMSRDPKIFNINETLINLVRNVSRDGARSPMQWSSNNNAGFSDVTNPANLWLPINNDYVTVNTEVRNSTYLKYIRDLVELRSTKTFKNDQVRMLRVQKDVITYARELVGYPTYFVAVNLADFKISDRYYLHNTDLYGSPEVGTIVFNTNGKDIGTSIDIRNITLNVNQAIIVKFSV